MTFVQVFRGYNKNNSNTWDENMGYIKHSDKITINNSIGRSPFEANFVYLPPFSLDIVYGM